MIENAAKQDGRGAHTSAISRRSPERAMRAGVPRSMASVSDRLALALPEVLVPLATAVLIVAAPLAGSQGGSLARSLIDVIFVVAVLLSVTSAATLRRLPRWCVVVGCIGVAVVGVTGRPNLFVIAAIPLLGFVLEQVSVRTVLRRYTVSSWLLFGTVVALNATVGFNADMDITMWRSHTGAFAHRLSLGFTHPNRAMLAWLVLVMATLLVVSAHRRRIVAAMLTAGTIAVYQATDARTGAYLALALLAGTFLLSGRFEAPVRNRRAFMFLPVVLWIGSFGLVGLAENAFANSLLTGRPRLYRQFVEQFPLTAPFGTAEAEAVMLDNGYIHHFLTRGAPLSVLYLCLLVAALARPAKMTVRSALIVAVFLGVSLTETALNEFPFILVVLGSLELDRRQFANDAQDTLPQLDSAMRCRSRTARGFGNSRLEPRALPGRVAGERNSTLLTSRASK